MEKLKSLDKLLDDVIKFGPPGAGLRVFKGEEKVYDRFVGYANEEKKTEFNGKRNIANTMNSVHGGNSICDATVDRYISHMEDAFMLTRVKRYNVKGRKYIGITAF